MHRPSGSRASSPPSWPAASCIWRKRPSSSPRGERVAGPANGVKAHGRAGIAEQVRAADEPRYAIYFVPPADSALYRSGAGFLGYDCYPGKRLRQPQDTGLTASEWAQLTREPRRYGFHATLKAPFRLLPPFTEMDLTA